MLRQARRRLFTTVGFVLVLHCAHAAEPYWEKIRWHSENAKTEEERKAADQYIASLSPSQLITAGRECASEIESRVDPKDWDSAGMPLGFFYQYYPKATGNLKDLNPILAEIANKRCSSYWRRFLIQLVLSSWTGILTDQQRFVVVAHLMTILNDNDDAVSVREKIPLGAVHTLSAVFKAQRGGDQGKSDTAAVETFVTNAVALFKNRDTPLRLRETVLHSLMLCHRNSLPGSSHIQTALGQALQTYKEYPVRLWPLLTKYGKQLKIENVQNIIEKIEHDSKTLGAE